MLTASSSAWHGLFLPCGELGSCSQVPGALGAGAPDLTALREARLSRRRGRSVQRTWQQHRTFLNRQLRVRRTRWDWRPFRAGLRPHFPWPVVRPRTLAHLCRREKGPAAPRRVSQRNHPWSLGKRAQRWGLEGPRISCPQDPGPRASRLSSPSCLSLGPWTYGCGCGPSARYAALKPLAQSP